MTITIEYIWIDGAVPTPGLRSKTKVSSDPRLVARGAEGTLTASDLPSWGADGSSTHQAVGEDSDIGLIPVRVVADPFRTLGYLALCEVTTANGRPHPTNQRSRVRRALENGAASAQPRFGFEQEYTFLRADGSPLGFPAGGFPAPQGPYYCGVGAGAIHGRAVYEAFLENCLAAGLPLTGANWEVMPGQAEVQIMGDALEASDGIWLSRWILQRTAEAHGVEVSFAAKPAAGDWNGAGMHTNFSTAAMREDGGYEAVVALAKQLAYVVDQHLDEYGDGFEERLTGHHETCRWDEYRWGVADRTASVRIPRNVYDDGKGYLEDRRPNANADPYRVAARMLLTTCGLRESLLPASPER